MESANKHRTPSRCREWERKRRNKFNDAITKLGEIVNAVNDSTEKSSDNVQYPKIEIVQKAIICLTNCAQEKTQLKAEILALQVKLGQKNNKKDASTQVYRGVNKKIENGKYVKLLMVQKSKHNKLKENSVRVNSKLKCKTSNEANIKEVVLKKPSKQNPLMQKLPILLPRCNVNNKTAPENTIVVLPATPYVFPQRPVMLPSVPPAIVLVDPNFQTITKPVPIVSRNSGDITKTTMVNILPISAYSRPMSATKTKKTKFKLKGDIKKAVKKSKPVEIIPKEPEKPNDILKCKPVEQTIKENKTEIMSSSNNEKIEVIVQSQKETDNKESANKPTSTNEKKPYQSTTDSSNNNNMSSENGPNLKASITSISPVKIDVIKCTESEIIDKSSSKTVSSSIVISKDNTKLIEDNNETLKIAPRKEAKETTTSDKDKGNKLTNILETTLCDHAVDAGNARLELAEEFLAASPTAAFLMSFPLVSGNRADSPVEEPQNTVHHNTKDNNLRRNDLTPQQTSTTVPYFEKPTTSDLKIKSSKLAPTIAQNKPLEQQKFIENMISKHDIQSKIRNTTALPTVSNENPFLNLPMPSLISTNCTMSDSGFGIDFDCNTSKPIPNQSTSFTSNNNLFYKSDPFSTVKSTIYSTSSISSNHEFNGLGLYPCAMEKYTSKNKSEYANVEDNLMKIGSSRLTYDIDLGWSHKSLDFVNCTTASNTFKDNILTTVSAPYCTSYNPFNPEFHPPLVSNANKKDIMSTKPSSSFAETITSFYAQPTNLWTEDVPFYTNSNMSKAVTTKHQTFLPVEQVQSNNVKQNNAKHYEKIQNAESVVDNAIKSSNIGVGQQITEKYSKKSPNKMHINWMTSEIRPMQNNCNPIHTDLKDVHKLSYGHLDHSIKKQGHNESNYFPINMHNFPTQTAQEEFQMWPSTRTLGTTEISIDPPPINLPTLVGDLALGPHEKKKNAEAVQRAAPQADVQNCSNFLSVTQLMNRSTDNMSTRYQAPHIDAPKPIPMKQNIAHNSADGSRKILSSRLETHVPPPYVYNDPKLVNPYENVPFIQNKAKTNSKSDKNSKIQKLNYSAEALIRSGNCSQRVLDSGSTKFIMPQKYNDFNGPQDSSVAQVSHFPPILDYSDNAYAGQQFSATSLYNTTTNTISNSFYSNFMPGTSNLMSSNYASAPYTGDFIDYNQTTECNYTNHKYDEIKVKNNSAIFQTDKVPSIYKSSRRESTAKHKLECSKKDSNKKYQSKKQKLNTEVEEWSDPSYALWQNKTASSKRHPNIMSEELPFPNYVTNQMPAQYQSDFFNSHLMPTNVQSVGPNVDRSLGTFPATSRANFNLSTIFPEITMKVQ